MFSWFFSCVIGDLGWVWGFLVFCGFWVLISVIAGFGVFCWFGGSWVFSRVFGVRPALVLFEGL